ncbi:EAL domain-containing protein [Altericroceibacterium endophyticum]|uniref:EAL domain-containing protein n=1 Tax=Altericroceibacterium endophyticum TaxID=1808508 RepID=A0A6I4T1F1_9SPHN|nr:EAL domain-containing protein [Altericroceibacterium endophyticum]MXO64708.1 EAL domain-containing protein [Altericroceibacterium endophyticum]
MKLPILFSPDDKAASMPADHVPQLSFCMMLSYAVGSFFVGVPEFVVTQLLLAAAIAALLPRLINHSVLKHEVLAWALFMLPFLLFGSGAALWVNRGSIPMSAGIVFTASLAIPSLYLFRRQGVAAIVAQVTLWLPLVIAAGSALGALWLTLGGIAIFLGARGVSHKQLLPPAALGSQQIDDGKLRAASILRDYEQTGQGWFWETDASGTLRYLSEPVAATLGFRQKDLLGNNIQDLFSSDKSAAQSLDILAFHLKAHSPFRDLPMRSAVGEGIWWAVSGRPLYDAAGSFSGFRGIGNDLTERKRNELWTSRLAHFDSLTGLANRFQMSQTLETILSAPEDKDRRCVIMLVDLDKFKEVNDTLGHPAGDALLKQVASRLELAVKDIGRVGRIGGDEFQVILAGEPGRKYVRKLADTIIDSVSSPYRLEDQIATVGVSIGIAIAPDDGVTSKALIRNADLALYAAKDAGRGCHRFYAPELHQEAEERLGLERDLRRAITHGELELYYQPVIATATEQITGFEALMRWNHPEKGWIAPRRFVQIAEDFGLIERLGEWAMRTACHDLASWPSSVRVAVNLSPVQFANAQLPTLVTNAVAQAGIDPSRLELEITESVFLNGDNKTDAMFASLKRIGVRLALDDFGTGYSSLGYLRRAPFDKIKIDRSFVRGATQAESRNGAIIASITSLAQAMGMETTAEGVETLEELDLVRLHGCSHVQGYVYDRPLNRDKATERLRQGLRAKAHGQREERSNRHVVTRQVALTHAGHHYDGTIRNLSRTGALVEGLWNVPQDTKFSITLPDGHKMGATARWCEQDRMGVEFDPPLESDPERRLVRGSAGGRKDAAEHANAVSVQLSADRRQKAG